MSRKIIVSYDGTANEDDAIALGRIFARAGAEVSVAYVRHSVEPDYSGETLAQNEAEALLERAAGLLGNPDAARHVVTDRSTPEGLRALAQAEGADVIVFCSDSHTAKGHIAVGNSAQRLLEGGSTAVAIAPVGLAQGSPETTVQQVVAVGDANGGAQATAEALASALGAISPSRRLPTIGCQPPTGVIDLSVPTWSRAVCRSARRLRTRSRSPPAPVLVLLRLRRSPFARTTAGALA